MRGEGGEEERVRGSERGKGEGYYSNLIEARVGEIDLAPSPGLE